MNFLRRLIRAAERDDAPEPTPDDRAELAAAERDHEQEVLRGEHERLDDLQQRQLRYAEYAWQPPTQGGERRAEDNDRPSNK